MPSPLAAQRKSLAFSSRVLRRIMDNPRSNETAQSRLKQVGMMSVLYHMHISHIPLTLTTIIGQTGLTRSGVAETVDQLLARHILAETMERNSLGRGTARRFHIDEDLFEHPDAD
ncbi:MarR family transcriptional regulator [Phyllobacterium sp. 22229]|uniref:MarR family transcriptional regulator n=1 Tax=Phyllobacterium myrsinacearum TaxID=28101 RepID=A0A2S9J9S4_9HYPH|nr:MarR family transcriptional regulator [Phyllobacterium myrsinacearum]PRD49509.1 MarR family transcriptional regulator [Phyllobacterium myrsinacearum]PWV83488.1 hypothetical protein DEV92_12333 [Phyllobacterium myrsinacearum]RZS70609.1 hypothetical protein EV217_5311 [Phyllobacterium myrsinacearum]RZU96776.1 hypothetical protein EV654_5210 [Phyllobacterium myrsinacearum]